MLDFVLFLEYVVFGLIFLIILQGSYNQFYYIKDEVIEDQIFFLDYRVGKQQIWDLNFGLSECRSFDFKQEVCCFLFLFLG